MADHLSDIRRFDPLADAHCVQRLAMLVADALTRGGLAEIDFAQTSGTDRVRREWCERRLGFYDRTRSDLALRLVGETMALHRARTPVTYFYLLTKHVGRLHVISAAVH